MGLCPIRDVFTGKPINLQDPSLARALSKALGSPGSVFTKSYVLAKFAEEIYIECNQLRSLFLSILTSAPVGSVSGWVVMECEEALQVLLRKVELGINLVWVYRLYLRGPSRATTLYSQITDNCPSVPMQEWLPEISYHLLGCLPQHRLSGHRAAELEVPQRSGKAFSCL